MRKQNETGMTLIEVCIAMLVVGAAAVVSAQLCGITLRMTTASRLQSSAAYIAARKVEELRAGGWQVAGSAYSLTPSPSSSLALNTAGFVEYFDRDGRSLGPGAAPPPAAVFICRWFVDTHVWDPSGMRVIRVLATPVVRAAQAAPVLPRRRLADEALVTTVLTRKVQ
jgi:type II secretory pathway pseudopilin PulG